MVFQDFDQISERRRADRKRKLQRIIASSIIIGLLLIVIIIAGVYVLLNRTSSNNDTGQGKATSTVNASETTGVKSVSHSQGIMKIMCNHADYKEKCHIALSKQAKNKTAQPKDFFKAGISVIADEFHQVLRKASKLNFDTPKEKGAFEDCKTLITDATEEVKDSISQFSNNDLGELIKKVPDLNNWLSAVMSYQQTCIDGFPEGKMKAAMKKTLKDAKALTSNSLAMITGVNLFISTFKTKGSSRRLLEADEEGYPTWMTHEDRRILKRNDVKLTPNVTIAKDGTGNFSTISEALKDMPEKYKGRYIIYVKKGTYDETVIVTKKMANVTMYGDGSQKSIITGNKNFVDGVRTFQTASFAVMGEGFMAKGIGFRNTAGPEKRQAVAARVQADRSIFLNCRFEGYQDTLYAQTHRQFYRSCVITGTVDFIFGDAAVVFQNCMIKIRKPMENQKNAVTAQGRIDKHQTTGIVIQNCQIMADDSLKSVKSKFKSYLGRPWKEYSRTIIMESDIEDVIEAEGWMPWEGNFALETLYYAEYNNKGAGAKTDGRVKWAGYKKIGRKDALKFTVENFLQGKWVQNADVPVRLGLSK